MRPYAQPLLRPLSPADPRVQIMLRAREAERDEIAVAVTMTPERRKELRDLLEVLRYPWGLATTDHFARRSGEVVKLMRGTAELLDEIDRLSAMVKS